jgi:hypothetical protein
MRGDLDASSDENCWRTSGGKSSLKSNPKSPKCILVSSLNSALQNSLSIDLEEAGRTIEVIKKEAAVDAKNLRGQFNLELTSSLPRGRCVNHLSSYKPQSYLRASGGGTYRLTPARDIDLFVPINTIENAFHLAVLDGAYCSLTSASTTNAMTGVQTQYSVVPNGQFELETEFSPFWVTAAGMKSLPLGATSASLIGFSKSAGRVARYMKLKAPLAAIMSIGKTISVGPMSANVETSATMTGTLEVLAELEVSCSNTNGLVLKPISGKISELAGSVTDNLTGATLPCNDSSCTYYTPLKNQLSAMWGGIIAGLGPVGIPSLTRYKDAGLYLSLDTSKTGFVDGKALHLPLEVSTTNPCATGGSSGSGGNGGGGNGGIIPGPGGVIPRIDLSPGTDDAPRDGLESGQTQGAGI